MRCRGHFQWVWNGEPLDGKRVLIRCYHGLGDTIQFIRYTPLVQRIARRADPPWYPTMRLFRQEQADDRRGVVDEVIAELRRVARRGGRRDGAVACRVANEATVLRRGMSVAKLSRSRALSTRLAN